MPHGSCRAPSGLSRQPTPSSMWSLINGDVLTRPEWVGLGGLPEDSTKSLRRAQYFLKVYELDGPEVHGPRLDVLVAGTTSGRDLANLILT
jgi:hypothetical protein